MISVRILLSMVDFSSLGDVALVDLTTHSELHEFKRGTTLDAGKYKAKVIYLLSGALDVSDPENTLQTVETGTPRAQHPVFRLRLPGYKAICKADCKILFIDEKVYDKYIGINWDGGSTTINVTSLNDVIPKNANGQLIAEIENKFLQDKITLPSLPEMALHIQKELAEENLGVSKLSSIVQEDPVITARIINVANSPIFGRKNITSIKKAITIIGLDAIQAIVISAVLRDLFKPESALIKKTMARYYEHSMRIGIISYVLAKGMTGYNRDHAFLAGLLHDIGVIPLLVVADRHAELSHQAGDLDVVIEELKGKVGSMLLKNWGFDEDLCNAAAHAYDWQWQSTENSFDYVGLVQVALMHSSLVGGKKIKGPPLCDIPAFKNLGLDKINPVEDLQKLKKVSTRVTEMIKILCND